MHTLKSEPMATILIVGAVFLYFVPVVIAMGRGMSSSGMLLFLNIILGWTVLGWFFCILWAATGSTRAQETFYREAARDIRREARRGKR
jgi:uncharacterized membrane protein YqaE (UPF0057 family)